MKRLLAFGVVFALLSTFGAGDALAQVNLNQPDASVQGLLDLIQSNANTWNGRLHGYAVSLFWSLAVIQFVVTFFPLVIRGADFGEIVGELVKIILTLGFFAALLMYSAEWAQAIIDSFREAGAAAAGLSGKTLQPGDMFATAVDLAYTIYNVKTWNPLAGMSIAVAGIVVLLCFAFIAAFMFVTLVESYIVINASVLFMGFGGSQWTRDYSLAILRYAVSVGAKLFVLTLIVGIIMSSAHDWEAAYSQNDSSMLTMVGLALVCAYLAKSIPDLIQGMISGVSPSGGATIGAMAAAALTGGAAGAAAMGAATAAGAAGAAGGAAGASGGGGLAGLLNSSISGGANMARSAMGNVDSAATPASTLAPRVGGATTGSAGRSAGMNGSGPSAARTVAGAAGSGQGGQSAKAQQASTSGKGASGPSPAQDAATAEPASAEVGSSAGNRNPVSAALSGVATGIAVASHLTAKLASLSVPGMEGMGAGLPTLPPSEQGSAEDRPFKGDDVPTAPTNTIMPAPTDTHPAPPAQEVSPPSAAQPPKE